MWSELLEFLPHVKHLVPLADKYFASRGAMDKAQEAAVAALNEEFHSSAAELAEAQSSTQRMLVDQSRKLDSMAVDVARTRTSVENSEARIAKLEKSASVTTRLLIAILVLSACAVVLVAVLLLRR